MQQQKFLNAGKSKLNCSPIKLFSINFDVLVKHAHSIRTTFVYLHLKLITTFVFYPIFVFPNLIFAITVLF